MDIKLELFAGAISDAINNAVSYITVNTEDMINSAALNALTEIKNVICDASIEDDFEVIEEIIEIFHKYNISTDLRHDFV